MMKIMDSGRSSSLSSRFQEKLCLYKTLLPNAKNDESLPPFWDFVLITAMDETQAMYYRAKLAEKKSLNQIPRMCHYRVIADPPGLRIGNGGSTLHTVESLLAEFSEDVLGSSRILLIHAGGYSRRMPNASAHGKVFISLPLKTSQNSFGSRFMDVLDVLLANYIDMLPNMDPGVFVVGSDMLEFYQLPSCQGDHRTWYLKADHVVAFANPLPLHTASQHGVFKLANLPIPAEEDYQVGCKAFLHKQTPEQLVALEATFLAPQAAGGGSDEQCLDEDCSFQSCSAKDLSAWTDGSYFMASSVVRSLTQWYIAHKPLHTELEAWKDFLTPLTWSKESTPNLDKDYGFQKLLVGVPFEVILLKDSYYVHIGTLDEYLKHFCHDPFIDLIFQIDRLRHPSVCLIDSTVLEGAWIGPGTLLEHSSVDSAVRIGRRCVVSGCTINGQIEVPDNTFIHTLAIKSTLMETRESSYKGFVTVAFGIDDDTKYRYDTDADPLYFGKPLENGDLDFTENIRDLWHLELFQLYPSAEESFLETYKLLKRLVWNSEGQDDEREERSSSQQQDFLPNGDLDSVWARQSSPFAPSSGSHVHVEKLSMHQVLLRKHLDQIT